MLMSAMGGEIRHPVWMAVGSDRRWRRCEYVGDLATTRYPIRRTQLACHVSH